MNAIFGIISFSLWLFEIISGVPSCICMVYNRWSIFLKRWQWSISACLEAFFRFVVAFLLISSFFMLFSFAERSNPIADDKLFFCQHCFDVFFEPPQSNQTKYSIDMPRQLNGYKNCSKQKFYIYRLKSLHFS